jgi:hypothetical protein
MPEQQITPITIPNPPSPPSFNGQLPWKAAETPLQHIQRNTVSKPVKLNTDITPLSSSQLNDYPKVYTQPIAPSFSSQVERLMKDDANRTALQRQTAESKKQETIPDRLPPSPVKVQPAQEMINPAPGILLGLIILYSLTQHK